MADSPLIALVKLTPKEAVAYLKQREQLTKSFNWQDVWQEEHAYQFTVSRLANLDILEAMRDGILSSVKGDSSRQDWTKNAKELLIQAGWWGKKSLSDPTTGDIVTTTFDPPRLKLIFDTNTRMAYAAGLWQRIERNKGTHPYIRYITRRDERVREQHRSWDNLTLPVDHSFWKTHFPPNGWRCRCRAMSISQADYDAGMSPNGERLNKTAPDVQYKDWTNKRTGAVERVPVGIDPGFGYNPVRADSLSRVAVDKLDAVPAVMRRAALSPQVVGEVGIEFKRAVDIAISGIPERVREYVYAAGYEVKIAPMLVDIKPSLSGLHPRGYPPGYTWENVDGILLRKERVIAVGQTCIDFESGDQFHFDANRSSSVLRHEFGHAADLIFKFSSNPRFVEAYTSDLARIDVNNFTTSQQLLLRYMMQEGMAGRQEVFAEAFASIYGGGTSSLDVSSIFSRAVPVARDMILGLVER